MIAKPSRNGASREYRALSSLRAVGAEWAEARGLVQSQSPEPESEPEPAPTHVGTYVKVACQKRFIMLASDEQGRVTEYLQLHSGGTWDHFRVEY